MSQRKARGNPNGRAGAVNGCTKCKYDSVATPICAHASEESARRANATLLKVLRCGEHAVIRTDTCCENVPANASEVGHPFAPARLTDCEKHASCPTQQC